MKNGMGKRILLTICLVILLLAAGCVKKAGGDEQAAIMVDGVIYYSTDTAVLEEPDEDTIRYTSSYAENGVPSKDGEANFNRESKNPYALLENGTVAVLIDGRWIEFRAK